jgi:tetratricopeptide (TPR) repeat protein
MMLSSHGFSRRWSLALGSLLLFAAPGCEQQPTILDRAAYDSGEPTVDAPPPARSKARIASRKIAPSATKTKPQSFDVQTVQAESEPPLSQPISTPLPAQIISTAEAETAPQPAAYVGKPAAAVAVQAAAPQLANTMVPSIDVNAAIRQVDERNRRGAAASAKAAWFTARGEFSDALTQLAAALDARDGTSRRTGALNAAFTALTEAEAFTGRGVQSPAAGSAMLAAHKTAPFVGPFAAGTSSTALHEAYVRFATERLAEAVAGCEPGSVALHGLGKVHNAAGSTIVDGRSKARAFYEAALVAAPANFLAANDLAVLLAEEGRLEQSRDLLHDALRRSPQPAMWNNLAAVNERLGRADLAQLARQEALQLERRAAVAPGSVLPTHNVAWLDPRSFAATSRTGPETAPSPAAVAAQPKTSPTPAAAKPSVNTAQRPANRALAY